MNADELFININKLPKPLTKQETLVLLDRIKQGDEKAKTKLVEYNIRLVLYEVQSKFRNVKYDKKDLVSIGNIGLMKAITTFDTSKNIELTTYAVRCIDNEILMFLRKLKKYEKEESLDKTIKRDKEGNELKIEDILSDDMDIDEQYTNNELNLIIRQIIKDLPDRDRKIIELHFGFCNNKIYTQKEIAEMLSISQAQVSRIIKKLVKYIGEQLEEKGIIELRTTETSKDEIKSKKEEGKKMAKKLRTIYEYFNLYTKEQVDSMLEKLSEEERTLILLRYGDDLSNPVSVKLTKEETNKFYGYLVPKMKSLLANPNKEIKPRKKRVVVLQNEQTEKQQNSEIISQSSNIESMTKENYIKTLEFLRTPSFNEITNVLSVKEAVIIVLKLGYIDGKYFSTDSIAHFLDIESHEVIDTTKKVLLLYKDNINQFIDNAIQIVTEIPEETSATFIK